MGTYHYYSPEMWDKKYDEFGNIKAIRGEVSDLWALGITFYRLATGRFPYEEVQSVKELKNKILNVPINYSLVKNNDLKELLMHILNININERATFTQI